MPSSDTRTWEELKARIKELAQNADRLLMELCEAGLYELGSEESPENSIFDDVAKAACALDKTAMKETA